MRKWHGRTSVARFADRYGPRRSVGSNYRSKADAVPDEVLACLCARMERATAKAEAFLAREGIPIPVDRAYVSPATSTAPLDLLTTQEGDRILAELALEESLERGRTQPITSPTHEKLLGGLLRLATHIAGVRIERGRPVVASPPQKPQRGRRVVA